MKHAVLTSVGHNVSDSLACGNGFLIGHFGTDVFGEAARSPEGFIGVDFLTGETSGDEPSPSLARAIRLYAEALPRLCESQGAAIGDFGRLVTRYFIAGADHCFVVEITDSRGKTSCDRYVGLDSARAKRVGAREGGASSSMMDED